MFAKMLGEFQEGGVLFAHAIQNANGAGALVGKADDLAPRAAKFAVQRLHPLHRPVKMLLKQPVQNVHRGFPASRSNESEATVFPSYPIPAWCPQLGNAGFREGVNDLSARYRCFRGVFPEVPRRAAIIQGCPPSPRNAGARNSATRHRRISTA